MTRHMAPPSLSVLTRTLDRHRVPETVTVIVCVGLIALGADMVADPISYALRPSFSVAVGPDGWAHPRVWGLTLIAPCVGTILSLVVHRRDVYWPLTAVTGWLTCWSVALALGTPDPQSVRSAAIIYSTLSLLTGVLSLVYMREGRTQGTPPAGQP